MRVSAFLRVKLFGEKSVELQHFFMGMAAMAFVDLTGRYPADPFLAAKCDEVAPSTTSRLHAHSCSHSLIGLRGGLVRGQALTDATDLITGTMRERDLQRASLRLHGNST